MLRSGDDHAKQTNEIGAFIPLIEALELDLTGKTLTADALLTQRHLAREILDRQAHYLFTVKGNQANLLDDLTVAFAQRGEPDFRETPTLAHGRIESRAIWTTTQLNDYLDFPGVGQAFVIERHVVFQKTGKETRELAYGVTSHPPRQRRRRARPRAQPQPLVNRELPLHPRLELGRGSLPDPNRLRSAKHHAAAPLYHRAD